MRSFLVVASWRALLVIASVAASVGAEYAFLTISFCAPPQAIVENGVVLRIPTDGSGNAQVQYTFQLPGVEGTLAQHNPCPLDSPMPPRASVTDPLPRLYGDRKQYLSFNTGYLSVLDLDGGLPEVISSNGTSADDHYFRGFYGFAVSPHGIHYADAVQGLVPHAEDAGVCTAGCFRFGQQVVGSGVFTGSRHFVPFRRIQGRLAHLVAATNIYYSQVSHPLTKTAACSHHANDPCVVGIDADTGKLLSSKRLHAGVIWNSAAVMNISTPVAFVDQYHHCNGMGFVHVDFATGRYKKISCIGAAAAAELPDLAVAMSSFSRDASHFAIAGTNEGSGRIQLHVFDVVTGKVILAREAGATDIPFVTNNSLFRVWGIALL